MQIYLEERIGNPDLFTGREANLVSLLNWVDRIKKKISQSRAILSRRKTGKTALLQRLYNIIFEQNNGVVPFYYEIKETDQWALDFCEDFFLEFIYQYISFKTRKHEYLRVNEKKTLKNAVVIAKKEGLDYLPGLIDTVYERIQEERLDILWTTVRDAPQKIAEYNDERIVQIIDEFQFLNRMIFWDKEKHKRADNFAGGYLSTAESKNAPLLVSGSWVGWLMDDLIMMLPGRFFIEKLENMPENEALEMVLKYSHIEGILVSEDTIHFIADLTEGNPFYISSLFRSPFPDKDLTTGEGVIKTLEFETQNSRGIINGTWMEYVNAALSRVNDLYAKQIVLYLAKKREREVSRKELKEKLNLTMSESKLEKKLNALINSDIIEEGKSNFYYRGVQDNIFDKVFRSRYADDIEEFNLSDITNEYKTLWKKSQQKFKSLSGKTNYYKGLIAEFFIINILMHRAYRENTKFLSKIKNLPADFRFLEYKSVWSYKAAPVHIRDIQIDILARIKESEDGYCLIGEVKNREDKKFSEEEARRFQEKAFILMELEKISKAVFFVFSSSGFTKNAISYMKENNIAWTDDQSWIEKDFT